MPSRRPKPDGILVRADGRVVLTVGKGEMAFTLLRFAPMRCRVGPSGGDNAIRTVEPSAAGIRVTLHDCSEPDLKSITTDVKVSCHLFA